MGVDKRIVFDGIISLNKHYSANIFVGILDMFSDVPAFAYAPFKLTRNYFGALTRAWNTVNNAEGDVYPDITNWLSGSSNVIITTAGTSGYTVGQSVSFSTFCSTNLTYHKIIYDQTGNGRHLNTWQAGGNPPIGCTSGTIDNINGKAAFKGTGSHSLWGSVGSRSLSNVSAFLVTKRGTNGSANYNRTISYAVGTAPDYGSATSWNINNAGTTTNLAIERNGQYATKTVVDNTTYVVSCLFDGTNEYIRLNNDTAVSNTSSGTFTFNTAGILGGVGGGNFLSGWIGALIHYDSLVSSTTRQAIERYLGGLFGVSVA